MAVKTKSNLAEHSFAADSSFDRICGLLNLSINL